jgi:hydroxylysine kinase
MPNSEEGKAQGASPVLPLGIRPDVVPPAIADIPVAAFLRDRYAVAAEVVRLPSERDQVLLAREASGRKSILRIAPIAEGGSSLGLQNAALNAIARHDPELPIPIVIESRAGREIEYLSHGDAQHAASLYAYLEGEPVGRTAGSREQRLALGTTLARLDSALATLDYAADGDPFLWNVLSAGAVRPMLAYGAAPAPTRLAEAAIDDFEQFAHARICAMPRQFIHNDFNPKNVLVDPSRPAVVTGVIDFGDLLRAPRIVDVGVAIARQTQGEWPVEAGAEILGAYHRGCSLGEEEVDVLYHVVCARLAIRIAVWGWRIAAGSAGVDPALPALAADLLGRWRAIGANAVTARYRRAVGHAP